MYKLTPDNQTDHTDLDSMQNALHQLLEQISKRDQKIAWINSQTAAMLRAHAEKEQTLMAEKQAILIRLAERESLLNEIETSKAWKIALLFRQARLFLIPSHSRRARVLRQGLNFVIFLFKKVKRK